MKRLRGRAIMQGPTPSDEAGIQTPPRRGSCKEASKDRYYPFTSSASTYGAPTVDKRWGDKDELNPVPALLRLTVWWGKLMLKQALKYSVVNCGNSKPSSWRSGKAFPEKSGE